MAVIARLVRELSSPWYEDKTCYFALSQQTFGIVCAMFVQFSSGEDRGNILRKSRAVGQEPCNKLESIQALPNLQACESCRLQDIGVKTYQGGFGGAESTRFMSERAMGHSLTLNVHLASTDCSSVWSTCIGSQRQASLQRSNSSFPRAPSASLPRLGFWCGRDGASLEAT